MKDYVIEVKRIKTNEFEVKAKSLKEAEQMVRDVVFNSPVLELDILNINKTRISIRGSKVKKVKKRCKYL